MGGRMPDAKSAANDSVAATSIARRTLFVGAGRFTAELQSQLSYLIQTTPQFFVGQPVRQLLSHDRCARFTRNRSCEMR